jgi:hypothetical protein
MRIVYRSWAENAAFFCAALAAGGFVAAVLADSTGSQGPTLGWWGGFSLIAIELVVLVRILRRGVTFDDQGLTRRDVFVTWFAPWIDVTAISFSDHAGAVVLRDGQAQFNFRGSPPSGTPSMAEAYARVRATWDDANREAHAYPNSGLHLWTYGFLCSALAVFLGGVIWDDARSDAAANAARSRRDRHGVAVVSDVRVDEDDNGDGDPTYTTHVDARLRLPDGRLVTVRVHRDGDLASAYHDEDQLPIVYDVAHPLDADFADRPTRRAQESSATTRETAGPLLALAGLVGLLVCGTAMGLAWTARLRDRRTGSQRVQSMRATRWWMRQMPSRRTRSST